MRKPPVSGIPTTFLYNQTTQICTTVQRLQAWTNSSVRPGNLRLENEYSRGLRTKAEGALEAGARRRRDAMVRYGSSSLFVSGPLEPSNGRIWGEGERRALGRSSRYEALDQIKKNRTVLQTAWLSSLFLLFSKQRRPELSTKVS